ncbi:MAG TPA: D-alanyl-D-alanine carboxypeptidase/D-alanyl-D-alanine-endopeptidase [Desulfobacterales bacterium]
MISTLRITQKMIRQTVLAGALLVVASAAAQAGNLSDVRRMIGSRDAILVQSAAGQVLLAQNEEKLLIPASTLKVFTSLVALHYLGADYRFHTDFFLDNDNNLKIKGYGDPLLISEVVATIGRELAGRLTDVENIVLDDSHFVQPLEIPGISSSTQPYDAPNGALCVNFNTVFFKRLNGKYVSAEPQTPLMDFALQRIRRTGLSRGRVVLSQRQRECTLYAGHLFAHFMQAAGIEVRGRVILGSVDESDTRIYRHLSEFTVEDIITRLLEHSNNFTTNQLLIAAGVAAFGPPGNLDKGVQVARQYARRRLALDSLQIVEGSGISRANRITARDLCRILDGFAPHCNLMRQEGTVYYKTGTLHGISTRAGYIQTNDGELIRFAILVNTPGKSSDRALRALQKVNFGSAQVRLVGNESAGTN